MPLIRSAVLSALLMLPAVASAQGNGETGRLSRTLWGHPDLSGHWVHISVTPLERPEALGNKAVVRDEEAAAFVQERNNFVQGLIDADLNADSIVLPDTLTDGRTSLVVDPPSGRIPHTAAGRERLDTVGENPLTRAADAPEDRTLTERCIKGPSAPVFNFTGQNANFWLFQTPDHVVIFHEAYHEKRIVPLDGRPPLPPQMTQWNGDSRGRWEGDTLVVETTNFHPGWTLSGSAPTMRLVERFSRVDEGILQYAYTVDDPTSFTQPWTVEAPMTRREDVIYEFACHEGNYSMPLILNGGRALEREEATSR